MQHVLVSWQANVNKITLWKTFLLRFGWKLHMSQVNRSHGWESSTNTIRKIAHYQIQWDFARPMTFVTTQDIIQAPTVCWYIELISMTVLWTQRQAIVYSRHLLTQLCCISSLSWANCTQSSSRCMAIDRCLPLLVATGGSPLKARSTCASQWQQNHLKPQAISHDLPTPSIPPIWDAKDTSTLVFFLHLLHS